MSQEFRIYNPKPGESPDLGLWADLLDADEIAEIQKIRLQRHASALADELERFAGVAPRFAGGPGSGNFGHSGRPGEIGGSGDGGSLVYDKNVTPEAFIAARDASDRSGFLSPLSPEDLKDAKLYLTKDGKIGGMLTPEGDMGNLFNNGGPKGQAAEVLLDMIADGGKTADCFDGYLPKLYANFGLVETGRMKFNRDFAPPKWDYKTYGTPDVVFLGLKKDEGTRDQIRERVYGDKANWTKRTVGTKYYDDFDKAKADARGASHTRSLQGRRSERGVDSRAGAGYRRLVDTLRALFDPDQARDESGKWTTGGGSSGGDQKSGDPHGINVKPEDFPHTRSGPSYIEAGGALNENGHYVGAGLDTEQQNTTPDGKYTTERERLHADIVAHFIAGATPQTTPLIQMMGGGAASGKSTMQKELDIPSDKVHIDVDKIRALLPEYKAELAAAIAEGRKPSELLAAYTHEESSKIGKDLLKAAVAGNFNALVDTVGDSGIEKLTANVERMRANGTPVHADYVTMDVDKAIAGAIERSKQPPLYRSVPESTLRLAHRDVSNTFVKAIENHLFDRYTLWDNNGPKGSIPTKVVSGERGKPMVIHHAENWKKFLAKGEARIAAAVEESYWYRILVEVLRGVFISPNDSPVQRHYRETVKKDIEAILAAGHNVDIPAEMV